MVIFSNPRLKAEITDYPLGGAKRGLAVFEVKFVPKKGYKFFRTTTGKPKSDIAYGGKAAIVDGNNGRTYLIQRGLYGGISIHRSDFKSAETSVLGFDYYVSDSNGELWTTLNDMIDMANP